MEVKEDCNGNEAMQGWRDRREVRQGRSQGQNMMGVIRQISVSGVTSGVRWADDRAGEAPEGP
jgi:hypothetical protein